jgi:hypothetical protein
MESAVTPGNARAHNFYAASAALSWKTAMRLGASNAGRPRSVWSTAVDPATLTRGSQREETMMARAIVALGNGT